MEIKIADDSYFMALSNQVEPYGDISIKRRINLFAEDVFQIGLVSFLIWDKGGCPTCL